jgi:cell wall assembly regulator SMI1
MIFDSRNEELKFFFDEINKYTTNVHSLNPGVELNQIEETEKKLDIKLPDIYKEFLQVCNGGELFIPGTVLAEIYHPELGEKQKGTSYINESYRKDRRPSEMPNNLCIIADLNYGDVIAFDLSTNNGKDANVIQWDSETKSISRTWPGFSEWLKDVLEEGSMLVDYDGNEKELDF